MRIVKWLFLVAALAGACAAAHPAGYDLAVRPAVFTGRDVSAVELKGDEILVTLDAGARKRFASYTAAHVGEKLEVLAGGKVVFAPKILDEIDGGELAITASSHQELVAIHDAIVRHR